MSRVQEGGCACGAIHFTIAADPVFVAHCHCRDCQRMSGAQMSTVAAIPEGSFRLESGEPKVFITIGSSGGKVRRRFCAECGSTLYCDADAMPGMVLVETGSLNDASGLQPSMHIFTRSAQPWATIPEDMPSYPTMPPS